MDAIDSRAARERHPLQTLANRHETDIGTDQVGVEGASGVKKSLILDYARNDSGEMQWKPRFDFVMVPTGKTRAG